MKRTSLAAILAIFVASVCCCLGALPLAAGSRVLNGSEHLTESDGSLNASYKQIRKLYASDAQFLAKLTTSLRAWLKFRDAELDALFPHAGEPGYYGSIYQEARAEWMAVLSDERCKQLGRWLGAAAGGSKNLYLTAFLDPKQELFGAPQKTCTLNELSKANDAALNGKYQRIIKDRAYSSDRLFLDKFRTAQRAWLKFRDAETEALVPHGKNDKARLYAQAQLAEDRSRQLLKWIRGVSEGDVFAGSIKTKQASPDKRR